jgi:hypothetical protein
VAGEGIAVEAFDDGGRRARREEGGRGCDRQSGHRE